MRKFSLLVAAVLCLATILFLATMATAQTKELTVPAGTLLQCTMDEPNFSSRTAHVGDPILCHIRSLTMFGRPVFPRGAFLSGRLAEFRDPGHFYGKGRLKLEFVSLTVPGGTFPLSAKVVSVPHYRVDAGGDIRGRGHAKRDAVEWCIPILWPEKIITLPARGPRPTLKGETPLLLRLMDDLYIPSDAVVVANEKLSPTQEPSRPSASLNSSVNSNVDSSVNSTFRVSTFPRVVYGGTSRPAEESERSWVGSPAGIENTSIRQTYLPAERASQSPRPTVLILKDSRGYLTTNYWIDGGQLFFVGSDGTQQFLQLEELDFQMTSKLNRERGVVFTIRSKTTGP
jgi:hypothetical protein